MNKKNEKQPKPTSLENLPSDDPFGLRDLVLGGDQPSLFSPENPKNRCIITNRPKEEKMNAKKDQPDLGAMLPSGDPLGLRGVVLGGDEPSLETEAVFLQKQGEAEEIGGTVTIEVKKRDDGHTDFVLVAKDAASQRALRKLSRLVFLKDVPGAFQTVGESGLVREETITVPSREEKSDENQGCPHEGMGGF
jgi:hypothetical protein